MTEYKSRKEVSKYFKNSADEAVDCEFVNNTRLADLAVLREWVEKSKKDNTITGNAHGQFAVCKTCGEQETCACGMYNQALSDLLELLTSCEAKLK